MIAVEDLTKRYGDRTVVDGLGFKVAPGRIVAFLGPNGAGKTTTLRMLLGLAFPTSGHATIQGRRYHELGSPAQVIGAVVDRPQFHPGRSGRDHLRVIASAAGIIERRVDAVLAAVELTDSAHRPVRRYSLGMRQRLSIAGALLGEPAALILDEPANALDPRGHRWLHDLLGEQRARGVSILISSHHIPEIEPLADDVVMIHRGRCVAQGHVSDLCDPATTSVRARCGEPDRLLAALTGHHIDAELLSTGMIVARNVSAARVGDLALAHRIAIHQMDTEPRTLEDVFLELTADNTEQ